MHREDARTVSQTVIRVEETLAEIEYHAGSPCEELPTVRVEIPLLVAAPQQKAR
jgi:hypothetical protein